MGVKNKELLRLTSLLLFPFGFTALHFTSIRFAGPLLFNLYHLPRSTSLQCPFAFATHAILFALSLNTYDGAHTHVTMQITPQGLAILEGRALVAPET